MQTTSRIPLSTPRFKMNRLAPRAVAFRLSLVGLGLLSLLF